MTNPILYVEDEEDYQILVKRILGRAGLEVVVADTGAEGMKELAGQRPSLLILDINLPDTDGYKICKELRQDPAWVDLPILMLTVRRRPDEWLRGFSSGATDYISKPINPPELVDRVVHCLEGRVAKADHRDSPEFSLIQSAVQGNRAAFEVLIEKYKGRLTESLRYSVRRNVPIDDVIADAFARAWENLREFRGEASFYTWLYRIAVNESIGACRRSLSPVSLDELATDGESHLLAKILPQESLDEAIAGEESRRLAADVLASVPPLYREMLELYFLHDLTYEAIAKKLRIPAGTVMSRLFKARKMLQEAWQKDKRATLQPEPAVAP